ncbi:hypothetical protein ScPMuIL_010096 [Solemya velum]
MVSSIAGVVLVAVFVQGAQGGLLQVPPTPPPPPPPTLPPAATAGFIQGQATPPATLTAADMADYGGPTLPFPYYKITIVTGGLLHSATYACVKLAMIGTAGTTGWFDIGNVFKWESTVVTYSQKYVGTPTHLSVVHDGSRGGSDWFLDYIKVERFGRTWYFLAREWIKANTPITLPVVDVEHWCIAAKTKDHPWAATDSVIYGFVVGTKGTSETVDLNYVFQNDNEQGGTYTFCYWWNEIGVPRWITIYNSGHNTKPGWHLDEISVYKAGSFPPYTSTKDTWIFPGQPVDIVF